MFDCGTQDFKMYELGLCNNIFVINIRCVQQRSTTFKFVCLFVSFSFFLVEDYLLNLIFTLI